MEARSFAGVEFDRSQRLPNGDALYVLMLRERAVEIVLATVWLQLARTGLLDTVWPGGIPSLTWLITWATAANNRCFGCFLVKSGTTDLMIVGLGWAIGLTKVGTAEDGTDLNKVEVGMVFYPSIQRTRLTHEFADMMISWGFDNLGLAVVYGTIPTPNRLACRFALRMGLHYVGTAPSYQIWRGAPVACEIYAATKEQWASRGAVGVNSETAEA